MVKSAEGLLSKSLSCNNNIAAVAVRWARPWLYLGYIVESESVLVFIVIFPIESDLEVHFISLRPASRSHHSQCCRVEPLDGHDLGSHLARLRRKLGIKCLPIMKFGEILTQNMNESPTDGLARVWEVRVHLRLPIVRVSESSLSPVMTIKRNFEGNVLLCILIGGRVTHDSHSGVEVTTHDLVTKFAMRYDSPLRPVAEIKPLHLYWGIACVQAMGRVD